MTECVDLIALREALEASWDARTSYGGVWEEGNPALGQCYPTVPPPSLPARSPQGVGTRRRMRATMLRVATLWKRESITSKR